MGTKIEIKSVNKESKEMDPEVAPAAPVETNDENIIYQGFLEKRSDFWKSWRSRFFSLRLINLDDETGKESIYLYYWISKDCYLANPNKPRGVFHLNSVRLRLLEENVIALYTRLVSNNGKFEVEPLALLRAHDTETARTWIRFFAYAHLLRSYSSLEVLHTGEYNVNGETFEVEVKRRRQTSNKTLLFLYRIQENEVPAHVCDLKYGDGTSKLIHGDGNQCCMFQIVNTRDLMSKFQSTDIQKLYNSVSFHISSTDEKSLLRLRLLLQESENPEKWVHHCVSTTQKLFQEEEGQTTDKFYYRGGISLEAGETKMCMDKRKEKMENYFNTKLSSRESSGYSSSTMSLTTLEASFESTLDGFDIAETPGSLEYSSSSLESDPKSDSPLKWHELNTLSGYMSAFVPVRTGLIPKITQGLYFPKNRSDSNL